MTTIYLDTSVAMAESFLKSPYCEAFLKACSILQYNVVIPEIVIDELKGNFPKKLAEKVDSFEKSKKELSKLVEVKSESVDIPKVFTDYQDWLDDLLDDHGVAVTPYPEVDYKEIVEKSYSGKKPFKESGDGHKDYIVWKSIVSHIEGSNASPPNIFLTNNTKDFCKKLDDDNFAIHPDLGELLNKYANKPSIFTSIKNLFECELSPKLEGMEIGDIANLGNQDIESMTGEFLLEDLPGRTIYGLEDVPFGNDISISSVGRHSIDSVSLKKVDNEVLIIVIGYVEIEVDGFVEKWSYYSMEEDNPRMYVVDGDWNDHVMMVSSSVETIFNLTIFYSLDKNQVTGHEVSLPQEIEDEWPYK